MPFKSVAQQHFLEAHPEKLGKKGLKEWQDATDYSNLPEHVAKETKKKVRLYRHTTRPRVRMK